ncbi:SLIT and NTRK-like protein 1, partial [Striga asiatica]
LFSTLVFSLLITPAQASVFSTFAISFATNRDEYAYSANNVAGGGSRETGEMALRCRPSAGVGNHPMARKAEPEGYGCPSLVQPMVGGAEQAAAADREEGRRILRFAF